MPTNTNTAADLANHITADRAATLAHNIAWSRQGVVPIVLHGVKYFIPYRDLFDRHGDPR